MTAGTIKTKGTRLYFALSASEILKVACPTGATIGGGAADDIDITCLDSEEREFVQGLKTPDDISLPVNFISRSASHQALEALYDSGETVSWMVVLSDQAVAPSALDSEGHLVSPGPTTREFLGYVKNITMDLPVNDIVRATVTIKRSGPIAKDNPASDLS